MSGCDFWHPDLVNDFEDLQQLLLAVLRQPSLRVLQAESVTIAELMLMPEKLHSHA